MTNLKEVDTITKAIQDAEWRLGSYMVGECSSRDDDYAQRQIEFITKMHEKLGEAYGIIEGGK